MEEVRRHTLPNTLDTLADRYDAVIGVRDRFLWKWFHVLNPYFRLSSVRSRSESKVRDDKTLLMFYLTLLDDLLEERGDRTTFREATRLPFDAPRIDFEGEGVDEQCLGLAYEVWDEFERSIEDAPRYEEFRPVFRYDLRQVLCGMRYSSVVNAYPQVANLIEAYAYDSHSMAMFAFANVDLMHSPAFDRTELPQLRRCLWTAQRMARIGNWVATWERELASGDLSSGVLIYAYENGLVGDDELRRLRDGPDPAVVETVSERIERGGVREALVEEWDALYERLERADRLESVDVGRLLDGVSVVLRFHLDGEGLI